MRKKASETEKRKQNRERRRPSPSRLTKDNVTDLANWLRRRIPSFAHRIAPIYAILDWRWRKGSEPPTEADITMCLVRLVDGFEKGATGQASWMSATGGLYLRLVEEDAPDAPGESPRFVLTMSMEIDEGLSFLMGAKCVTEDDEGVDSD